MPTLYIITGPSGIGKSTVSKLLASSKEKSALIEGDDIYHQVVGGYIAAWKDGNHLKTFWKVCIESMKAYLADGYDVVFNYIVNPAELKQIREELHMYHIKFVVLMTSEKELLRRDALRPEDCQMKERCLILLNSFKEKNFSERFILDTSYLKPEEVVKKLDATNNFLL